MLHGRRVGIDTAIFIYALESHPKFGRVAIDLFARVERSLVTAVASDLVLGELIVRPLKLGRDDVVSRYLEEIPRFPNLLLRSVSREMITEAARLRSRSSLSLVDALHLECAKHAGADFFITNDRRVSQPNLGIDVIQIEEIATE